MGTLRKLLNDQVRVTERKSLVLSKRFREALEDAMIRYTNKQITTVERIRGQGSGGRRQGTGGRGYGYPPICRKMQRNWL
jgi:hypothetical protein